VRDEPTTTTGTPASFDNAACAVIDGRREPQKKHGKQTPLCVQSR